MRAAVGWKAAQGGAGGAQLLAPLADAPFPALTRKAYCSPASSASCFWTSTRHAVVEMTLERAPKSVRTVSGGTGGGLRETLGRRQLSARRAAGRGITGCLPIIRPALGVPAAVREGPGGKRGARRLVPRRTSCPSCPCSETPTRVRWWCLTRLAKAPRENWAASGANRRTSLPPPPRRAQRATFRRRACFCLQVLGANWAAQAGKQSSSRCSVHSSRRRGCKQQAAAAVRCLGSKRLSNRHRRLAARGTGAKVQGTCN